MRWYYTDPLAAAWMLRHFGMQFPIYTKGRNSGGNYSLGGIYPYAHRTDQAPPQRWYIHPASLHLLEPQAGDVAQHPMNGNCHVMAGQSCFDWFARVGMKIIQRNGIAFHWPEREP